MTARNEARTFSIEEAANLLGISRNQAYDAAKRNEIPVLRIGKRILVPKAALARLLGGDDVSIGSTK